MTIKEVHDWIDWLARKKQSGYNSREQKDMALHRAQMDLFVDLYGNDKQYQPGRPVPPTVYGETIFIHHALEPFKEKLQFNVGNSPGGMITMPEDCQFILALHTTVFNAQLNRNLTRRVEVVNEEELIGRLESQLAPVSLYDPLALVGGGVPTRIQLYPEQPQSGTVFYLRAPAKPRYNYTTSGRTEVFNPVGSVDLEWKEAFLNRVVFKACQYLGMSLSDAEIIQFSDVKDKQGA